MICPGCGAENEPRVDRYSNSSTTTFVDRLAGTVWTFRCCGTVCKGMEWLPHADALWPVKPLEFVDLNATMTLRQARDLLERVDICQRQGHDLREYRGVVHDVYYDVYGQIPRTVNAFRCHKCREVFVRTTRNPDDPGV